MPNLLVVDDSAADRRLAAGLLQRSTDHTVIFAADGREALVQIERHLPDVVITDLQMPNMNGLQLVEAVKKQYPLIPVILMTAQGSEEIAVEALRNGAASYVPKSNLADDLLETVDRVFASTREQRSHTRIMHRMTNSHYSFVLENDLTLISSLVSYLRQTVRGLKLCAENDYLRHGIALEEALLNAYYHGNLEVSSELRDTDHEGYYKLAEQRSQESPYKERRIYVDAKFSQQEASYIIRDEGKGFDPATLPDPTDPANLERPSGRGILLMRTFMDEIHFNPTGNEVRLVKRKTT